MSESDEMVFDLNDDEFAVDFSEAVEFKIVDAGWYQVEIVHMEKKVSTDKNGNPLPQLSLRLKIVSGEYEGQQVFVNWPLRGRGSGITKQGMAAAFGTAPESGQSFSKDDLMGAQLEVFIRPDIWKVEDGGDGEARNKVQRYRSLTDVSEDLGF